MNNNDAEPYEKVLQKALETVDDPNASEKQQRSALARIKRVRGRSPERGVSAFDFEAVPVKAMRAYYSSEMKTTDYDGDKALASLYANPVDFKSSDVVTQAALQTRPYYLVKVNNDIQSVVPNEVAFHMMRRGVYNNAKKSLSTRADIDDPIPFESGANLLLFDDITGVPILQATVVDVKLSQSQINPASGGLTLRISKWSK